MAGIAMLGAVAIGLLMRVGTTVPGHIRPGYAIAVVIAMTITLPLAIRYNTRMTDELDQMDMLKANSWGLYVYFVGQFSWMVLASSGIVPPPNAMIVFLATAFATLGCYFWLKIAR